MPVWKRALVVAAGLAGSLVWVAAQTGVPIDADDIGGVVISANGPEAGVWVIAETTDLPTKLARIVVTDDQGRYVVPDLPEARYELFVRGYGLLDSARVPASPGDQVDIDATVAPDARAAAQVYPAGWWLTTVEPPADPAAQLDFALTMKQCYPDGRGGGSAGASPAAEPDQPVSPGMDHRIGFGCYSVAVSHADGSLWCSGIGRGDRRLVRLEKGDNPPETCVAEYYEPPPGLDPDVIGSGGVEVDGDGVAWQNWRVSGHFSAFNRTLCDTTSDPQATGQSCAEGWSFRRKDDPTYGDSFFHANESYLAHMDFHDTLGLGADAPIYGSVNTDAMEVFSPNLGRYVTLRVPYPLGFFPRSGNGRIDDPDAGWKGRGYWASFSTYATWHIEGGRGEGGDGVVGKAVKFQMRPDPLAR